jgi:hypothetical protein
MRSAEDPTVPAQAGASVVVIKSTRWNMVRLQDKLDVEVELRSGVQSNELGHQEERFSVHVRVGVREKLHELAVTQRSDANPELTLNIPDPVACNGVHAEFTVPVIPPKPGLARRVEDQPLALIFLDLNGHLEIAGQEDPQPPRATVPLGEQTRESQQAEVVDTGERSNLALWARGDNAYPIPQPTSAEPNDTEQSAGEPVRFFGVSSVRFPAFKWEDESVLFPGCVEQGRESMVEQVKPVPQSPFLRSLHLPLDPEE